MSVRRRLGTTVMGSLLAGLLAGAPAPAAARQAEGGPGADREEIEETIEIYMIAKMKRSLDLTSEQERKVIPAVEALNGSRREFNHRRRSLLMRLRALVEDDAANEREIASALGTFEEAERRFRDEEMKAREEIRANLTVVQQAKFILFQDRFRQEMQDRIRRLDQEPGRGPGGGFPPPPRDPGRPRPPR